MATKQELRQAAYRVWAEKQIAKRVQERTQASLIGRAWEVGDPEQVEDFAAWFVEMGVKLGVKMQVLKQ